MSRARSRRARASPRSSSHRSGNRSRTSASGPATNASLTMPPMLWSMYRPSVWGSAFGRANSIRMLTPSSNRSSHIIRAATGRARPRTSTHGGRHAASALTDRRPPVPGLRTNPRRQRPAPAAPRVRPSPRPARVHRRARCRTGDGHLRRSLAGSEVPRAGDRGRPQLGVERIVELPLPLRRQAPRPPPEHVRERVLVCRIERGKVWRAGSGACLLAADFDGPAALRCRRLCCCRARFSLMPLGLRVDAFTRACVRG